MARKTKTVVVPAQFERDKGKQFIITEMPARRAEDWANRLILALGRSGVQIPEEVIGGGMAAFFAIGARALFGLSYLDARPLLDEMLSCVQVMTSSGINRPLVLDDDGADIEEALTYYWLRAEIVELHTGFSVTGFLSTLGESARSQMASETTPTSPAPLEA